MPLALRRSTSLNCLAMALARIALDWAGPSWVGLLRHWGWVCLGFNWFAFGLGLALSIHCAMSHFQVGTPKCSCSQLKYLAHMLS